MNLKELLARNGVNHAVYALISYFVVGLVFMTTPYFHIALWITLAVNTIVWFMIEYNQEKAMLSYKPDRVNHGLKFWKWSKDRKEDMGYPFLIGLLINAVV